MAQCLVKRVGSMFKATIAVQANVGATITATGNGKTFSAVADSVTGIANIIVKKKGTYTLNTDSTGKYDANGNTSAVIVSKGKEIYAAQLVKLTHGYTTFKVTNEYASKTLLPYWTGALGSTLCNGNILEEIAADDTATKIYSGEGTSYTVNTSLTVTGYLISNVASGTTKTYRLGAYITINGKDFYGGYMTASSTAADYSSVLGWKAYKSTQTITVPKGCHSITAYCVGGGGGGGGTIKPQLKRTGTYDHSGGGGGGGGYVTSKTFVCIPGQNITITIGGGGGYGGWWANGANGGTTTVKINNDAISASGGEGGRVGSPANGNTNQDTMLYVTGGNGGNGGSGGGAGCIGFGGNYYSINNSQGQGTAGGSNGSNAEAVSSSFHHPGVPGRGSGVSTNINGTLYGAGGGGGSHIAKAGGNWGGGSGGCYGDGGHATANSGGGGGGSQGNTSGGRGGNGGSGVAIINFAA